MTKDRDLKNEEPYTEKWPDAATAAFIREHRLDDVRRLAFQADKYPAVDMPFALDQIQGWQMARRKLPSWAAVDGIIYPPHINMEQCSSEQTARYKARNAYPTTSPSPSKGGGKELLLRLNSREISMKTNSFSHPLERLGEVLVDLTGGFGVDFSFMSRCFKHAVYVEKNPRLCAIAHHNFTLLGLKNAEIINSSAESFLISYPQNKPFSLPLEGTGEAEGCFFYLDPSRRDAHGHKVFNISDCEPDVVKLAPELLKFAARVMIKLSPMFDWHEAVSELPSVSEVHIVSVDNECKELLVVLDRNQPSHGGDVSVHCVNDEQLFTFISNSSRPFHSQIISSSPSLFGGWDGALGELLVPNSSIMAAGCFDEVAIFFGVEPLSQNSHLFISSHSIDNFPGRDFQILAVSSMNKHELKKNLAGISKANIAVRNFPMSVEALRKRLKIAEGGDVYIFATTLSDGSHVLIITKKLV